MCHRTHDNDTQDIQNGEVVMADVMSGVLELYTLFIMAWELKNRAVSYSAAVQAVSPEVHFHKASHEIPIVSAYEINNHLKLLLSLIGPHHKIHLGGPTCSDFFIYYSFCGQT